MNEPLIRSARYLGPVPRPRSEEWVMVGQDGGQSIPLGDGRSLFVFADTLVAPRVDRYPQGHEPPPFAPPLGERTLFFANCAGVGGGDRLPQTLAGLDYFTGTEGFIREILPATAEEAAAGIRFWPEHGVAVDGVVYLFYVGIEMTDPHDVWGFHSIGVGLARLDVATGRATRCCGEDGWALWRLSLPDFHLGVQVLREGADLYVYGSRRVAYENVAFVGRVPAERVGDPASYRYCRPEDDTWVADLAAAGTLGPAAANYSVSYNPHLDAYLLCYIDGYAKELLVRVGERPWGPFGPPASAGQVPHDPASELVYLAFEHPQFARDDGRRLALTYSQPRFVPNGLVGLRVERGDK